MLERAENKAAHYFRPEIGGFLRQGVAAAAYGFHIADRQLIGYQRQLTVSPDHLRQAGGKTSLKFDVIRITLIRAFYTQDFLYHKIMQYREVQGFDVVLELPFHFTMGLGLQADLIRIVLGNEAEGPLFSRNFRFGR